MEREQDILVSSTPQAGKIGEPVIMQAGLSGAARRRNGSEFTELSSPYHGDDDANACTPVKLTTSIILIALLAGYLLLGGLAFWKIEGTNQQTRQDSVNSQRAAIISALVAELAGNDSTIWNISSANLTTALDNSFLEYHAILYSECSGGTLTPGVDIAMRWEFFSGYVLALTIVTTIGYGHILPRSTNGQIFCIFYALIGIPLFLLFLGNLGNCIATWVRKRARAILRWYNTRRAKKRKEEELSAVVSNDQTAASQTMSDNWVLKEQGSKRHQGESSEADVREDSYDVGIQADDGIPDGERKNDELQTRNKVCAVAPWAIEDEGCDPPVQKDVKETSEDLNTSGASNNNHRDSIAMEELYHIPGAVKQETKYHTVIVGKTGLPVDGGNRKGVQQVGETEESLSFVILNLMFFVYVFLVALIVYATQPQWTYFECIYFCIITITTIGFGDYVLTRGSSDLDKFLKPFMVAFFIILGLMIISAIFNTAQVGMRQLGSWIVRRIKSLFCRPCKRQKRIHES